MKEPCGRDLVNGCWVCGAVQGGGSQLPNPQVGMMGASVTGAQREIFFRGEMMTSMITERMGWKGWGCTLSTWGVLWAERKLLFSGS